MATQGQVVESEEDLVRRAQTAISQCNWVVGECAAQWTKRFSRGRTDTDFAALVGMSADQVYQRRRVWETFGDVSQSYPNLKWSHFYAALTWDDAAECLQWAEEIQATVAEMKAWRRMRRGEDLTLPAEDEPISDLPSEPTPVRFPGDEANGSTAAASAGGSAARSDTAVEARSVARMSDDGSDYAPFREGAGSPSPANRGDDLSQPARVSTEQLVKRMTTAIERCNAALTDEILDDLRELPEKIQRRFLRAVGELAAKVAELQ